MNVDDFDYGSEDARYLRLKTNEEKQVFLKSYVIPARFKLNDFLDGYKYFVFGGKGSGKTALLQYVRLHAEMQRNAACSFFYFQSSFSKEELKTFLAKSFGDNGGVIDDTNLYDADEATVFWRLFLFTEVAKVLRKVGATEGVSEEFLKLVESAKLISQSKNVANKYPNLQKFSVLLSRSPQVHLEGTFENATTADLTTYLDLAEVKLGYVYLDSTPIFIFIDEMETYLRGDESDSLRFSAIASLVRAVRDFNEKFSESKIRVIAAIRDAVVDQVSLVQGEIHRVIRDNGVSLDWPGTIRNGFHPLEQMVLRRIILQDPAFSDRIDSISDSVLKEVIIKYFPKAYSLRNCLNLTWYRPRDVSLLFEEAAAKDKGKNKFSEATLADGILRNLGRRMWQDAVSGLAVKYKRDELGGMERILRGGARLYTKAALIARMDSLSHTYDDVAILSDARWIDVIEDLYKVGVVFSVSPINGHKNFSFRGDPMPSLTDDFEIGVHTVLLKELSIS